MVRGYQPTERPTNPPPPQGGSGTSKLPNGNPTKTDAIKSAVNEEIERKRREIDVSYTNGSSTIAIIIRLRQGRPYRISFRTESETNL
jgi:hypothetical protein